MVGDDQGSTFVRHVVDAFDFHAVDELADQPHEESDAGLRNQEHHVQQNRKCRDARDEEHSRSLELHRCPHQRVDDRHDQHAEERHQVPGGKDNSQLGLGTAFLQIRGQRHVEQTTAEAQQE